MGLRFISKGALVSFILGVTSATALQDDPKTEAFNVTYFQASGTPHSLYGIIVVDWTPDSNTPVARCEIQPAGSPSFPTTDKTACTDNPSMFFGLKRTTNRGAKLELWYEPPSASPRYGVHNISPDEIEVTRGITPTGDVESYYGPPSFTVGST
ncbi:hypothetical protein GGS21DRAFT_487521 [Xylaria nigripes]|nr:hypothetical protein GGS21DRAFT_487521 [Xylaria nigripes]